MQPLSFLLISLLHVALHGTANGAEVIAPDQLAQRYSLTASTSFPFPTATQSVSDTEALLVSGWGLGRARVQNSPENLQFVADPYPSSTGTVSTGVLNSTGPVLQVTYPAKSFSHETGGTQFFNLWNNTSGGNFLSMILTYELAFEDGFDWVKGGKLPGLRGGLNSTGCSGGNQPTGDCFSARLMWRKNANGEVYAYIPTTNDICSRRGVICNSDFGTSFNRGSFGFTTGRWNRVTILTQLNNPPNVANGQMRVYYNDEQVVDAEGLQIRNTDQVSINGLFFSTFFGGNDDSWATPNTVHSYFRNIQMWGGENPSSLTGPVIKSNALPQTPRTAAGFVMASIAFGAVTALV
ncbi:hypothetical protein EST38_g4206 [Candolleomyces aberdarensis]|uniref:Polysaccharide lyase 14 domain-containing protein n=1 Tax=Candolleomyces aberdarensis TaxID=2316362 RepID=A0A4Q2DNH4_9AGAR|nr:hypothetical protein EST38_g4206 [Candolleomyces aberdarensis]